MDVSSPADARPSSCDVSDACDELAVDAVRSGSFRPLWAECPAASGRLATVRLERMHGGPSPLPELLDFLSGARDRVVLVDLRGRTDCQCWGAVLGRAAVHYGVSGVVVSGAVRDVGDLAGLGLPTYARGVYPGGIRGRLSLAAVDEPVELDDGVVDPGSFTVADASGVVFVPERADAVFALARERQARELDQRQAVLAGADPRKAFLADAASSGGDVR